jgi:hypothetical protein
MVSPGLTVIDAAPACRGINADRMTAAAAMLRMLLSVLGER